MDYERSLDKKRLMDSCKALKTKVLSFRHSQIQENLLYEFGLKMYATGKAHGKAKLLPSIGWGGVRYDK